MKQSKVFIAGVVVTVATVLTSLAQDRSSSLLELDGIFLDRNAEAVLGGSESSTDVDRRTPTDKLLHQHEAGELDGIALDNNAVSMLTSHRQLHLEKFSQLPKAEIGRKLQKGTGVNLPAQQLLERGEVMLSAGRYGSAVRLLRKAKKLWGQNSGNSRFAETLIQDIKRAHPISKHQHAQDSKTAARMTQGDKFSEGMKWAAKTLSSGKEFRSLYGLMRDRGPMNRKASVSEHAIASKTGVYSSSARTTVLSEENSLDIKRKVHNLVKSELKKAEQKLEKENKAVLRGEEAEIFHSIRTSLLSRKSVQKADSVPADSSSNTPAILSWPKGIPPSLQVTWSPTMQLTSQPSEESVEEGLDSPKYLSHEQRVVSPGDYNQQLAQKSQANSAVPVINLNLPSGEKLPPGRYALDGSVVPDAAGQLDFVGNLVRVSPPGIL